ncbi:MAG: GIY-YIG nuclease family protein [Candidatus Neomarinimicrobiota bacterium]
MNPGRGFESLPLRTMYWVYVLQSKKDGGFYTGYTQDLDKRVREHNAGKTRSLRGRMPLELVYSEEFPHKRAAKERERQIKSWKGGEGLKNLMEGSPRLRRD